MNKELKTYWCIKQKYYDNGEVEMKLFKVEAKEKPDNVMAERVAYDEYREYYESEEDAKNFIKMNENA